MKLKLEPLTEEELKEYDKSLDVLIIIRKGDRIKQITWRSANEWYAKGWIYEGEN